MELIHNEHVRMHIGWLQRMLTVANQWNDREPQKTYFRRPLTTLKLLFLWISDTTRPGKKVQGELGIPGNRGRRRRLMAIISMASTPEGHHCLAYVAMLTAVYCVAFDPSNMSPDPVTGTSPVKLVQIHSCYTSLTPYTVSECVHPVSIVYDSQHEVLFVVDRKQLHV